MTFDNSKVTIVNLTQAQDKSVLATDLLSEGYHLIQSDKQPKTITSILSMHQADLIILDFEADHALDLKILKVLQNLEIAKHTPVLASLKEEHSELREQVLNYAHDLLSTSQSRAEQLLRVKKLTQRQIQHQRQRQNKTMLELAFADKTEELAQLNASLLEVNKNLETTNADILLRLAKAAEYRDDGSEAHTLRVGRLAYLTAKALGLNDSFCDLILLAARLHDVGKIGIPDSILLRPGKLSSDEEIYLREHCMIGAELLRSDSSDLLKMAETIALSHHERWDGQGYPNNLKAESIPIAGRITSVVDVFDTLTHTRPYRRAWTRQEALELLREERGRHFDPNVIDAFMNIVDDFHETDDEIYKPKRPNFATTHF